MQTYIVVACFDNDSENKLFEYRRNLAKILTVDYAGTWKPHITLGCYTLDDIDSLLNWTESYAAQNKKIIIDFNSLGFFLHNDKYEKTDVIYAAPAITKELYNFYIGYHKKFDEFCTGIGWDYSMINGKPTIHSTITICKINEFEKAIIYMYNNFKSFSGNIESIEVYDLAKKLIKRYELTEYKEKRK